MSARISGKAYFMKRNTKKSTVVHRSANAMEVDGKLLFESLIPGLNVIQTGLYNAFHADLICLTSDLLGRQVDNPQIECKAHKSFAGVQIGLIYDFDTNYIELRDEFKSIPKVVKWFKKVKSMKDSIKAIMNKYPKGYVQLNKLSSDEIVACMQSIYISKNVKGFCIEDEDGNLMTFPIYSLPNYITASARIRWHRQGSNAHFAGTPYIDKAFEQIFIDQNCTYKTFRVKENKMSPSKKTSRYYNYLETDAQLDDEFKHILSDGSEYQFKRVGITNIWQVRFQRPVDKTSLCIEININVVRKQRKQDLEDMKQLISTGELPKRKYVARKQHTKHKYKIKT